MDNIISIDYKDWLINQKRLPDRKSSEAKEFYEFHKKLALEGFNMNGTFINPFLYWHLNMWHTEVDMLDEMGRINQKYINPPLRDNEWIITSAITKANTDRKGLAIGGIRRAAKDLLNSSKLYTPNQIIEIGNARIGDQIYDHNGELTKIIGVYPQGIKPVYKVTLLDGRKLFCGLEHNWLVQNKSNNFRVLTTQQLIDKTSKTNPFYIPLTSPVQYSEKKFIVDPYILGYHLGDGDTKGGRFASIDKEPIEEYKKFYEITDHKDNVHFLAKKLIIDLKKLSLGTKKFIPEEYFRGSIDQRYSLLNGLLDSDGCVSQNKSGNGKLKSQISFTNTNENLVEGVRQLVFSLGGSCTVHTRTRYRKGVKNKTSYDILIRCLDENKLFKINRKKEKIIPKINNTYRNKIKSIQYVFDAPTTCIMVDNKEGLFLTDNFTITHNSTYEASYTAWGASFDENSQNVISGLNSPDIKLITDKLDKGLNFLPWYYKWDRIEDNWKSQVTLGIKTKGGERFPYSYILIRNLDEGNNEEAIAGTKPRKLIIDEGAKGPFLAALTAAIPGFTTPYGWGCSPIVTFTGGDATKFNDAKKLFFDCEAFNFLEFPDKKIPGRKHGLFLGHTFRLESKSESTLGDYLDKPELKHVPMHVSDPEKAEQLTNDNLEKAKKSSDRKTYLKEKMYYPKEVDDIFLNQDTNIFDVDAAKIHLSRLKTLGKSGTPIVLKMTESGIKHEFTDKLPISNFPLKSEDAKDAPIVIYEFPIENPPYGLYVCGVDSYKSGQAAYSDSLGAVYIYKRMHNIISETYQDMMVASYVARPDNKDDWEEQARFLIEYYNARALVENDEISFIDHMKAQGKAHFLEKQPGWIQEVVPNTTVSREYGLHRSAAKIRNFLHNLLIEYCKEELVVEKDVEGNITKRITGISRIPDPMLLEEIIQYNEDGNFDRIVAFELALAQAKKLDPILGKISGNVDSRIQSLYKKNKTKKPSLFGESMGMFSRSKKENKFF